MDMEEEDEVRGFDVCGTGRESPPARQQPTRARPPTESSDGGGGISRGAATGPSTG